MYECAEECLHGCCVWSSSRWRAELEEGHLPSEGRASFKESKVSALSRCQAAFTVTALPGVYVCMTELDQESCSEAAAEETCGDE